MTPTAPKTNSEFLRGTHSAGAKRSHGQRQCGSMEITANVAEDTGSSPGQQGKSSFAEPSL